MLLEPSNRTGFDDDKANRSNAKCPSCDSLEKTFVEECGSYKMVMCSSCDLIFADPMRGPGVEYYQASPIYYLRAVTAAGALAMDWTEEGWRLRRVRRYLPPRPARVLDIGCGAGRFCHLLEQWGHIPTGLDFDPHAIELARSLFGLKKLHAISWKEYMEQAPEASFEAVCAFEVLEHLEDPRGLLQEVTRILVNSGILILSVPNVNRYRVGSFEGADQPPHHLTKWSAQTLKGLLLRTGWKVEHLATSPVMTFPLITRKLGLGVIRRRHNLECAKSSFSLKGSRRSAHLAQSKILAARVLTSPLDVALRLTGHQGNNLLVVARKEVR